MPRVVRYCPSSLLLERVQESLRGLIGDLDRFSNSPDRRLLGMKRVSILQNTRLRLISMAREISGMSDRADARVFWVRYLEYCPRNPKLLTRAKIRDNVVVALTALQKSLAGAYYPETESLIQSLRSLEFPSMYHQREKKQDE